MYSRVTFIPPLICALSPSALKLFVGSAVGPFQSSLKTRERKKKCKRGKLEDICNPEERKKGWKPWIGYKKVVLLLSLREKIR